MIHNHEQKRCPQETIHEREHSIRKFMMYLMSTDDQERLSWPELDWTVSWELTSGVGMNSPQAKYPKMRKSSMSVEGRVISFVI